MPKTNRPKTTTNSASLPNQFSLGNLAVEFDVQAAAGGEKSRPKLQIAAYNGDAVPWFAGYSLVIDTAKLSATAQIPVFLNHDENQLIGQGVPTIANGQINVLGMVTGDTGPAQHVLEHQSNGFVWRASIGVRFIDRPKFVADGDALTVNGRQFNGPIYVSQRARLGEVSLVPAGADPTATATIAASVVKENSMNFEQYVVSLGFDSATLSDAQRTALKLAYDAAHPNPEAKKDDDGVEAAEKKEADPVDTMRVRAAAEAERIAGIEKLTVTNVELRAKAIKDGWDLNKTELEVMRADRPTGFAAPAGFTRDEKVNLRVMEAAIRLGSSENSAIVEKGYDAQVLELAHKHRRMGFKALIQMACAMEGKSVPALHADIGEWVRQGFSTTALPTILGAVANKLLQSAFNSVPRNAAIVGKKLSANNFMTHTGARLAAGGPMKKVGSGGEIKKVSLSETSFSYAIDTFAKMIGVTRQQWINDDLGAFTELPMHIGRASSLAIEAEFWAMVEAAVAGGVFFAAGNGNILSGAGSALGITGMDLILALFRKLKDSEGNPISARPRYLVVPPDLEAEAERLNKSDILLASGVTNTSKLAGATNTHRGKYEPVAVPHLTSAARWYLTSDPADIAAFGVAYLNGAEAPTVEEAQPSPEYLGRVFRGFIDFGVCTIDPQGAITSAGS